MLLAVAKWYMYIGDYHFFLNLQYIQGFYNFLGLKKPIII